MIYEILAETSTKTLSKKVTQKLEAGYTLYGHPFADETGYFQAVMGPRKEVSE